MRIHLEKEIASIPQIRSGGVSRVTLSEPNLENLPIILANPAIEQINGYDSVEIIGTSFRFLQNEARDQLEIKPIGRAPANEEPAGFRPETAKMETG